MRFASAVARPSRTFAALAAGFACLAGGSLPARAAAGSWVTSDVAKARLLTAVTGTGALANVPAGVEVSLDAGWKTYWRSPGDAGLPPALDWAGSTNLGAATLSYPAPARLTLLGIQTFGYHGDVIFPIDVAVATPGRPLDLRLKLDVLVCAQLCVPKTFDLAMSVPAGPAKPDGDALTLAKARAAVPGEARAAGIAVSGVAEVSDGGKPALEVRASALGPFRSPDVIAEIEPALALGQPRVSLADDGRAATFLVPLEQPLPVGARLAGRTVTLTVTDGARALETPPMTIAPGASATREAAGPSLLAMLGVALLGGLILNLMPCVLPVLSLKLVAVIGQGGRAPGRIRAGFLATAAGVVASFLVIAGALIALKAAGRTIGWGLQFQQPAFIAAMAVLVTLFACHLAGLFAVPLPRFVRDAAARRTAPDEGLAGHFVTGAFATVLATPCSAPFLGTAVGFALAGAPARMLAIFGALGLGLASPYLLVAAVPRLAAALPRPGRWMLVLKQVLALPLLATALWLLSILLTQVGVATAASVAALLLAVAALLAWRERLPTGSRRAAVPAVALLSLAAIALPDLVAARVDGAGAAADEAIAWRPFDRGAIRSLVSQGRTVFVDVTADWCLTCQANRRLVLGQDATARRLNAQTVAMRADWTRPNPAIAGYLAGHGRYGIPFNVVYGPGAPGGIVLPELLTAGDVAAALDRAGNANASMLEAPPSTAVATAPAVPLR